MTDYLTRHCPRCGGRLCVDTQYPDYVFCDTCSYPEPDEQETADQLPPRGRTPAEIPFDGLELDVEEANALAAWRGWRVVLGLFAMIVAFALATRGIVFLWELYLKWRA